MVHIQKSAESLRYAKISTKINKDLKLYNAKHSVEFFPPTNTLFFVKEYVTLLNYYKIYINSIYTTELHFF